MRRARRRSTVRRSWRRSATRAVREGQALTFTVSAGDPDGDALSYAAAPLPSGAVFDTDTGMFAWTPGAGQSGSYSLAFTVTDVHGAADSETIQITVEENPVGLAYEAGRVTLSSTIDDGVSARVSFARSYTDPVVVAYIMTRNGSQSIDVRVKDVTGTGATVFVEEPDDEGHNAEEIGYIVMEAGRHVLADGTRVEAGRWTTSSVHREDSGFGGDTVPFTQTFGAAPVLLHTLNTYNNGAFMSTVSPSVTAGQFMIQQEAGGSGKPAVTETIGWIAIESGKTGTIDGKKYQTGRSQDGTKDGVTDSAQVISLTAGFSQAPVMIVDGYTGSGSDGYWARSAGTPTATTQKVYAEEDQVKDSERSHADEGFGWWAMEP